MTPREVCVLHTSQSLLASQARVCSTRITSDPCCRLIQARLVGIEWLSYVRYGVEHVVPTVPLEVTPLEIQLPPELPPPELPWRDEELPPEVDCLELGPSVAFVPDQANISQRLSQDILQTHARDFIA